jgi:hypothetical protein
LPLTAEAEAAPPFPSACLPGWLAEWVEAEAQATQTPPDLAGMLVLAIAAAAVARKFRVQVRSRWSEPLNLFTVVALPPGERKSAVFADAIAPVRAVERAEIERLRPQIAQQASKRRVLEQRLKALEGQAAKAEHRFRRNELAREIAVVQEELDGCPVPEDPQFLCDDATPEKLAQLLARQGGRLLQAAAEATPLEIARGRYSRGGNFDVYLKAHAGDPLRVHRIGREVDLVDQPALSVALAVQPEVLCGLRDGGDMSGRGFLARFLYAVPASKVGERQVAPPPRHPGADAAYQEKMRQLWQLEAFTATATEARPRWLTLTAAADAAIADFERWLEPRLAVGEPLAELAGWANKLAGAVCRIAGVFHLAGSLHGPVPGDVPAGPVAAAVELARSYLLPHARRAFGLMGRDERLGEAQAVLGWLARQALLCKLTPEDTFVVSRRDLFQAFKARFQTVDRLDPVLDLLVRHGWLRPTGEGRPGRGVRGPTYWVHPHVDRP